MRHTGRAAVLGVGALAATAAPSLTAIGPVRRRLAPRLAGTGQDDHVALTYDDGPDPTSTPAFLDLLARHQSRATFFLLAEQARGVPALVRRMVDEGHELAIHGWAHRCTLAVPPTRLTAQLRDAKHCVEDLAGTAVSWYRPPYGVTSTESLIACRTLDLTPVLWTAWGRDWEGRATAQGVLARLRDRKSVV